MKRAAIPDEGIVGEAALREAATTEFGQVRDLLQAALKRNYGLGENDWICMDAVYPDRVVIQRNGRQYQFTYTISDDNTVTLGNAQEVTMEPTPVKTVSPIREAVSNTPPESGTAAGDLQGAVFIEVLQAPEGQKPSRYLVRVIKAGTSLNNVTYPRDVLREATPLFNGARVFVKSDAEHIKGGGKDVRQLVGRLSDAKFVEAGVGEIQAVLDVFESADVAPMLREAVERGMTDLFGLSIDASGKSKQTGKFREATKLTKVASVDLIIEPGAGGQLIRFVEAHQETDTMLREQMIQFIEARDATRAQALANASDEEVLTAYREAVAASADRSSGTGDGITRDQLVEHTRMIEARADARVAIAESKLPLPTQMRLNERFREAASFTAADVEAAIKGEREYLGKIVDGAKVTGLGSFVEAGESRAEKMNKMLDDFFDPSKKAQSFRECYIEITGDRQVTGLLRNMDADRLREAAGERAFREAISSTTFGDILGDSITRAMVREYGNLASWSDWRWLCDVVPVTDFRTQERTRIGGFGNLPAVAEGAAYTELAAPGDEAASYAISKRGGLQTVTLETIANDDVGLLRRIPRLLATAAGRTLYEFVYAFLDSNAAIYDTKALFHADHANLGTAALDATSLAAARLAMFKQTELSSGKRLGIPLRHLAIPSDLETTAHDLFARSTNLDKTFVQSMDPTVHVVTHWTDANNWYATADNADVPLIELGFYSGQEDPELFVQDQPTSGSVFSNDKITYKIRHIYSGAVRDYRGFYGAIVA